ncbi:MAG: glycosyltransferase family 4 protein [Solirubrobacteraceae bacterium]
MLLENNPYPQDVRVRAEAESLARAGHRVTVVAPRDRAQPRSERVGGVDVVRFALPDGSTRGAGGFALEYLVASVALHRAALRALLHGATVLHIHNPPDIFFPAGALYRLAGRRVIFDHHDLFPETVGVKFGAGPASRVASWCQRMTFAVADHVIATNESYAAVAREVGRKRREQVTIVRNGPPAAWTSLAADGREGVLEQIRLAYLGAISSQDGVEGLAPVMARLCAGPDALDVRLTVIGDGDARPALEAALARNGVAERVTFTGWVAPARVPELLAAADLCVDPAPATDVNERSTMTKLAEYLALGKPVVAYDLLEARRTAGDAALLVPAGDVDAFAKAISELARDPALRHDFTRRARRRAIEELTWERSEQALFEAYAAVRTKPGPRRMRRLHRRSVGGRSLGRFS